MHILDLSMLALEHRDTHGLVSMLALLAPAIIPLVCLVHVHQPYHGRSNPGAVVHSSSHPELHDYRNACNAFDREVDAWQAAARAQGGSLS